MWDLDYGDAFDVGCAFRANMDKILGTTKTYKQMIEVEKPLQTEEIKYKMIEVEKPLQTEEIKYICPFLYGIYKEIGTITMIVGY